ncbi:MAG TPA: hypothetical protein PKK43_07765 [Spirochaetota bacterium]|nr:hypothetical protein [Spirochaetota bacterium]
MKNICFIAVILLCGPSAFSAEVAPGTLTVETDCAAVTLEDETQILGGGALGLRYFPGDGFHVLSNASPFRALMSAEGGSFLVEGSSIKRITRARKILSPGKPGSEDNGYIGIAGVYRHRDGTLYGICSVHDCEDLPHFTGGVPGYYSSVALVSSRDGITWKKLGRIITSHKPKSYQSYSDQPDRGIAECGIVADRNGKYLYCYYSEHSRDNGRGVPVCVARADVSTGAPLPGKWKKYYDGAFSEDALGGNDTPVISLSSLNDSNAIAPHPVYSASLGKYVMVVCADTWKEYMYGKPAEDAGVYLCFSDDGLKWSEPTQIICDFVTPFPGKSLVWQPTLVFDKGSSTDGWLVYGRSQIWGVTNKEGISHYLAGRRIHLEKKR